MREGPTGNENRWEGKRKKAKKWGRKKTENFETLKGGGGE